MICAVIPVKRLDAAKQRLSDVLSGAERRELMTAMVCDVLAAVCAHPGIERVVVVSEDPRVAEIARRYGAEFYPEQTLFGSGLNGALAAVAQRLHKEGVGTMMMVPGDLPLLNREDLDGLLRLHDSRTGARVTVVPDHAGTGSNGVVCTPPTVMTFAFGPGSFQRHKSLAAALGIAFAAYENQSMAQDIDSPADLGAIAGTGVLACHSRRYLDKAGIAARLQKK